MRSSGVSRSIGKLFMAGCLVIAVCAQSAAETEQRVEVTIQDYAFVLTKQLPLRLGVPTVISIRNLDGERHDFGSAMFDGLPAKVESGGVISYGRGIAGVFLDSKREAMVRFTLERPGRYEFRCSIHPGMKGELLLLNVEAV